jgi:HlyD family secretion protein
MNNKIIQLDQQELQQRQELLTLENDLNDKQRIHEKKESLHKLGGVSDEEYLSTKNSYEIALKNRALKVEQMHLDSLMRENQRANLGFQIELVRQQLENLKVKAPVAGQLSLEHIELGQTISKGTRIGQVSVLSSYKIIAQIDEHYIDRIDRGLTATFERQEEEFSLILSKVYPEVVGGTFKVDMTFESNLPQNIRMGQSYYIDLQLGETMEAMQIARGGFFQSTGGQWVYVLDPEGITASKRDIRIGRQNPRYYEVISGLESGEQVIVSGYDTFGGNEKLVLH